MNSSLPDNFWKLDSNEQRKLITQHFANELDAGNPNAWLPLLLGALTADPHIPEATKTVLRRRLIQTMQGIGSIDPVSQERRAYVEEERQIYLEVIAAGDKFGGSADKAIDFIAKKRGVSKATIRRRYDAHLKANPNCFRLDARRKESRPRNIPT